MQEIMQRRITMLDVMKMPKEVFRLFVGMTRRPGDFATVMQLFLIITNFTSITFHEDISTSDIVVECIKEVTSK